MSNVNHPAHYGGDDTYEVIKVIEAWGLDSDAYLFNTIKYIARAGKKPDQPLVQDLKKSLWYLERRIKKIETIGTHTESNKYDKSDYPLPIGTFLIFKNDYSVFKKNSYFRIGGFDYLINPKQVTYFGSSKQFLLDKWQGDDRYMLPQNVIDKGDAIVFHGLGVFDDN